MKNSSVQSTIDACEADLNQINTIINGIGLTSNIVPYLTYYAVIRSCGSIEIAYKALVADFCSYRSKKQIKLFIDTKIRENSSNPSYSNICKMLKQFDKEWLEHFKSEMDLRSDKSQLLDSLQSLVDARNEFAHGGTPSCSINDIIRYFNDSKIIIQIIDSIIL